MNNILAKAKIMFLRVGFFFVLFVYYLFLLMMIECVIWLFLVNIYPASACNAGMGKATLWGLILALTTVAYTFRSMLIAPPFSKQSLLLSALILLRATGIFILISGLITILLVNLENGKANVREYYKQQTINSNVAEGVVGNYGFDKAEKVHANLITGASEGNIEQIKYALQNGANVNDVVGPGLSALYYAASNGKLNVVMSLIKHGADMEYHNGPAQRTALHEASLRGHYDIVNYLLKNGANVNSRNKFDRTPLYYVTSPPPPLKLPENHQEIAKLLKRFGGII
ncbi:MAG: ankyrin repeat domain-containing protein [Candidatus Margulisiibacteriota bacterium]